MTVTAVTPSLVLQVFDGLWIICSNTSPDLWTLQYDWIASDGTFKILSNNQLMMSYSSKVALKGQQITFGGDRTKWKADGSTICTVDGSCYLSVNGGTPGKDSQVLLWPKSPGTLQFELDMAN